MQLELDLDKRKVKEDKAQQTGLEKQGSIARGKHELSMCLIMYSMYSTC